MREGTLLIMSVQDGWVTGNVMITCWGEGAWGRVAMLADEQSEINYGHWVIYASKLGSGGPLCRG